MNFRIRRTSLLLTASLLFFFFSSGCDTIADISFPFRSFEEINTSGFVNPAGSCGGTNGQGGQTKVRFVMVDDKSAADANAGWAIWPGDELGKEGVAVSKPQVEFKSGSLEEGVNRSCSSDSQSCGSSFSCQVPRASQGTDIKRCTQPTNMNAQKVEYASRASALQFFGVVLEESGSLRGGLPSGLSSAYDRCTEIEVQEQNQKKCKCDVQDVPCKPDGKTDSKTTSTQYNSIATDPRDNRVAQLRQMKARVRAVAERARNEGNRKTYFGLWSFSNQTKPTTYLEQSGGWTAEITPGGNDLLETAVEQYDSETDKQTRKRANVYQAVKQVIDNYYSNEQIKKFYEQVPSSIDEDNPEKSLVVFTDGPDELGPNDDVSSEDVISAAKSAGVRVFVVHLDPAYTKDEQKFFREDTQYFEEDPQASCSSDSECKDYESCRKVHGYNTSSSQLGEKVSPETIPGESWSDTSKRCMPTRGPEGRYGPIQAYAKLACQTNGGYIYLTNEDPTQKTQATNGLSQLAWLPYTVDGLWEATVGVKRLSDNQVPSDDKFIRIGGAMQMTAGERTDTYNFSQSGSGQVDTRSVIEISK